jgi:hypothetical protein
MRCLCGERLPIKIVAQPIRCGKKTKSPGRCRGSKACALLLLLASLRRHLRGLGRRVHRRLVGADVTEQNRTVRQILLHQAGAARGNRARSNSIARNRVVAAVANPPVEVTMAVAAVVVVAMVPEAAVPVVVVDVVPVVPVMVVVVMTMAMRTMVTVAMRTMMTVATVTTMTTVTAAVTAAVTATVTAAVTTRISRGRDEGSQADNGRGDESEECSTFEHSEGPLSLRPFGS